MKAYWKRTGRKKPGWIDLVIVKGGAERIVLNPILDKKISRLTIENIRDVLKAAGVRGVNPDDLLTDLQQSNIQEKEPKRAMKIAITEDDIRTLRALRSNPGYSRNSYGQDERLQMLGLTEPCEHADAPRCRRDALALARRLRRQMAKLVWPVRGGKPYKASTLQGWDQMVSDAITLKGYMRGSYSQSARLSARGSEILKQIEAVARSAEWKVSDRVATLEINI